MTTWITFPDLSRTIDLSFFQFEDPESKTNKQVESDSPEAEISKLVESTTAKYECENLVIPFILTALSNKTVPFDYVDKVARRALYTLQQMNPENSINELLLNIYEIRYGKYYLKNSCESLSPIGKRRFETLRYQLSINQIDRSYLFKAISAVCKPFVKEETASFLSKKIIEKSVSEDCKADPSFEDDILLKMPDRLEMELSLECNGGLPTHKAWEISKSFKNCIYSSMSVIDDVLQKEDVTDEFKPKIRRALKGSLNYIPKDNYCILDDPIEGKKRLRFTKIKPSSVIKNFFFQAWWKPEELIHLQQKEKGRFIAKAQKEGRVFIQGTDLEDLKEDDYDKMSQIVSNFFGSKVYQEKENNKDDLTDAIEKDFVKMVSHYHPQYKDYVELYKVFSPKNIKKALKREY